MQPHCDLRRWRQQAATTLLMTMSTIPLWLHAQERPLDKVTEAGSQKAAYYQCLVHRPPARGRSITKHYRFPLSETAGASGFNANLRWSRFAVQIQDQARIRFEVEEAFPQGVVKQAMTETLPTTWQTHPLTMTLALNSGDMTITYQLTCGPETTPLPPSQ